MAELKNANLENVSGGAGNFEIIQLSDGKYAISIASGFSTKEDAEKALEFSKPPMFPFMPRHGKIKNFGKKEEKHGHGGMPPMRPDMGSRQNIEEQK